MPANCTSPFPSAFEFARLPFAVMIGAEMSVSWTDDIIRMRYVEIEGQLQKIVMVIKMRGGQHSKDIRQYEITATGVYATVSSRQP